MSVEENVTCKENDIEENKSILRLINIETRCVWNSLNVLLFSAFWNVVAEDGNICAFFRFK